MAVVPASAIVSWVDEGRRFTDLPTVIAHGDNKQKDITAWFTSQGFLFCTHDGTRTPNIPAPENKLSQACVKLIDYANYARLMTSTSSKNKVSEFASLMRYIQPDLIIGGISDLSAEDFCARIAPAYHRLKQSDVLDEFPERTDPIDWINLTPDKQRAYGQFIKSGDWIYMFRSAMLAPQAMKIICQEGPHRRTAR